MAQESASRERDLVRKRGAIKAKLTSLANFLEGIETVDANVIQSTRKRVTIVEDAFKSFEEIQTQLELIVSDEQYDAKLEERLDIEEKYVSITCKAENIIQSARTGDAAASHSNVVQSPSREESSESRAELRVRTESPRVPSISPSEGCIKVPVMKLPSFTGEYEDWPGFRDAFTSGIHNNATFTDDQRLSYLKSCLTGKAAEKIESFENTARNYSIAWGILVEEYNNPSAIMNKRIRALCELTACARDPVREFKNLSEEATRHYRALEALGKPFLEAFPIYLIVSKMDRESRVKWKEFHQGTEIPTMEQLLKFLLSRRRLIEECGQPGSERRVGVKESSRENTRFGKAENASRSYASTSTTCPVCDGSHATHKCDKFLSMGVDERAAAVRKGSMCHNCLKPGHRVGGCKVRNCLRCGRKHHTLLHRESVPTADNGIQGETVGLSAVTEGQVLLATAVIDVVDERNKSHKCRVLLDSGSQSNFMTEGFAKKLGLKREAIQIPVSGLSEVRVQVTSFLPARTVPQRTVHIPVGVELADPDFGRPAPIDGILGATLFYNIISSGQRQIAHTGASLQETRLGWVIAGRMSNASKNREDKVSCHAAMVELEAQVRKFWEIEEAPSVQLLSLEERECEKHYKEHTYRDAKTGRYVVRLPFKENKCKLGRSYNDALRRFYNLERSLLKNAERATQYSQFMKEKTQRNRGRVKIYVAIFVCLVTKAVHIEVVTDLTTKVFLAALRRFFSRRGKCTELYSDNATNFVGADAQIRELYDVIASENNGNDVASKLARDEVRWHFIPPRTPHFGGLWEAAVKSFKRHFGRVIGDALLSFEQFLTYTAEGEAILNSRPLTPLSSDPNDLNPLTPGHFLVSDALTSVPLDDYSSTVPGRLSLWQHTQQMRSHLWRRWHKEYLYDQTVRKKWHTGTAPKITTGTMVILKEDNAPLMKWNLARVTAVHPGEDGVIRVVTVKTATGTYKRSLRSIAPLPVETGNLSAV